MAETSNVEEIPIWKQGLQERVSAYSGQQEQAVNKSTSSVDPVAQVQQGLNEIIDTTLAMRNLPSTPEHDNQDPSEQASVPLRDAPDPGTLRKAEFGFQKGKEELTIWGNATDFMITNYPEIALEMGLSSREQRRKWYKRAAQAKGEEDLPWIVKVWADIARHGAEGFTNGIVRMFGTEQEIKGWEAEQAKRQFGEGWMDMTPEQRRERIKQNSDAMLAKNFPDVYGTTYEESAPAMLGQLTGAMADPTTLLPIGRSYKMTAVIGGSIGASDATLYDLAKTGKVDPAHVAAGTALGTVLGPAMKFVGGRVGKFVGKRADIRTANKILDKYERSVLEARKLGEAKDFAHNAARVEYGLSTDSVTDLYKITGRVFEEPPTPAAARQALESRAGWLAQNRMLSKVGNSIDKIITPVSSRMTKLSPRIAHNVRVTDAATHIRTHVWFERVNPFLRQLKKLSSAEQTIMKKALYNGDNATVTGVIRRVAKENPTAFGDMMKNLKEVRSVLHESHKLYKSLGYQLDYEPGYFPRHWSDPKTEGALQKGYLAQTIIAKERKLNRPLTPDEVKEAVRAAIFHGKSKGKVKVSGSLRQRTIKRVPDSLLDFYADPLESLHSNLRLAAHDIERARFFRKFGYKGKLLTDGTDAGTRIDEVVQKEAARLGWSTDEMSDMTDMIRARFVEGEISPSRFIQSAKNIGYSTTLGNPLSAITQLGDQAFAMYKVGVRKASAEALRGIMGKREVTKADLGLTDAVEELFTNTSKTKTMLNNLLKYTGFNKIDQFGKENLMNGVLKKYRNMVKSQKGQAEFTAKYSKYFENEMPRLVSDLKAGVMSDNVKLLMWHELADVQPIALSEMPQAYLSHPNGRVFYMLKTFTIKQIDFMRREILQQFAKGHYVKGTKNLAAFTTFWLMANGAADGLKTVLTGEQFDVADNVVENLLQMVAWSRYSSLKTAKEGPMSAALDYIMPPTNAVDNIVLGAAKGDIPKLIEPIPFVGKIISKALKAKERKTKKIRQGVAARLK